ncbi:hypothetical protein DFQ10_107182 [Winogradskyella eximia]|uniref:Lipoprotein n=1 Tax=Winogradskyella eximia TaxID=262006 RepID=A0A3D9H0G8_9FLAO|nr:hypothetical protein [Winogradskyella eximia]RED42994.1 hypothetical protein DFQ10_107182 [Winogradskyella eximia]
MKKTFFNLCVVVGLILSTSCNKDDDGSDNNGASNELTVTIEGQVVTFDTVIVERDTFIFDGEQFTILNVTATVGTDASRTINFETEVGDLGTFSLYAFEYLINGEYFYDSGAFNSVVSVNNGSRLTATFTGTLTAFTAEGEESIMLENGIIDVNY